MKESWVWRLRTWIYIVGIAAFVIAVAIKCNNTQKKSHELKPHQMGQLAISDECFWPPDMVPHPNPPWDQPKDDEPEMA